MLKQARCNKQDLITQPGNRNDWHREPVCKYLQEMTPPVPRGTRTGEAHKQRSVSFNRNLVRCVKGHDAMSTELHVNKSKPMLSNIPRLKRPQSRYCCYCTQTSPGRRSRFCRIRFCLSSLFPDIHLDWAQLFHHYHCVSPMYVAAASWHFVCLLIRNSVWKFAFPVPQFVHLPFTWFFYE